MLREIQENMLWECYVIKQHVSANRQKRQVIRERRITTCLQWINTNDMLLRPWEKQRIIMGNVKKNKKQKTKTCLTKWTSLPVTTIVANQRRFHLKFLITTKIRHENLEFYDILWNK